MNISKKRLIEIIKEEMEGIRNTNQPFVDGPYDDSEGKMAMSQLKQIVQYGMELHDMLETYGENVQLEGWVQSKLTLAKDYISKVKHYLESETNLGGEDSEMSSDQFFGIQNDPSKSNY